MPVKLGHIGQEGFSSLFEEGNRGRGTLERSPRFGNLVIAERLRRITLTGVIVNPAGLEPGDEVEVECVGSMGQKTARLKVLRVVKSAKEIRATVESKKSAVEDQRRLITAEKKIANDLGLSSHFALWPYLREEGFSDKEIKQMIDEIFE